jgi:hypothetical protein
MPRARHSKKEVEGAVQHLEDNGWTIDVGGSHAWGTAKCPFNDDECRCGMFCRVSIASTPRNPGTHAKQLRRVCDSCIHNKNKP